MTWDPILAPTEQIQWQGQPAPRCFTFRNWRHSVFGILFLLVATFWETVGMQMAAVYDMAWLAWLPVPFILLGLYLSLGHLLLARLEWDKVHYLVTDHRVLVQRGLFSRRLLALELDAVTYFQLRPLGKELGTLRIHGDDGHPVLVLNCIEYPRQVTDLLEVAMGDKACRRPSPQAD